MSVHQARGFNRHESVFQHDQVKTHLVRCDWSGPTIDVGTRSIRLFSPRKSRLTEIQTLYAGIAGIVEDGQYRVAIALRNETYLLDFLENDFKGSQSETVVCDFIITELQKYSDIHAEKILGAAFSKSFHAQFPSICRLLWLELDIVPIVLQEELGAEHRVGTEAVTHPEGKDVDEQAESVSRKCVR